MLVNSPRPTVVSDDRMSQYSYEDHSSQVPRGNYSYRSTNHSGSLRRSFAEELERSAQELEVQKTCIWCSACLPSARL